MPVVETSDHVNGQRGKMKYLLTSAGIKNKSIGVALVSRMLQFCL